MDGIEFDVSPQELYSMLLMVLQMIQPSYGPHKKGRKTHSGPVTSYDTLDTAIEIYDYIRHVRIHPPEISLQFPYTNGKAMELADRPPESLEAVQAALETYVVPEWKGKVVLRNREDAPPCEACDLDPKEQWKLHGISSGENPSCALLSQEVIGDLLQGV
jgi:hypothetical protein